MAEQVLSEVEETRPEARRVDLAPPLGRARQTFQGPHEHRQLEVDLCDARGRGAHAGPLEDRLPIEELCVGRLGVPRPALRVIRLELDEVAGERLLQAGERGLDALRGPLERRFAPTGRARLRLAARPALEQAAER